MLETSAKISLHVFNNTYPHQLSVDIAHYFTRYADGYQPYFLQGLAFLCIFLIALLIWVILQLKHPENVFFFSIKVFVFDFGSELYVWNGQQSLSGKRKTVFAMAKQLYDEPFKVNGLYDSVFPYGKADSDVESVKARPAWTLFAQLHEKAETILFREKFLDWPDPTKIIKMKGHPSSGEVAPPVGYLHVTKLERTESIACPEKCAEELCTKCSLVLWTSEHELTLVPQTK